MFLSTKTIARDLCMLALKRGALWIVGRLKQSHLSKISLTELSWKQVHAYVYHLSFTFDNMKTNLFL